MLAISAAMLSTATYAWFTMAKDVSVEGISMTATVPATLQISLGHGTNTAALSTQTIDNSSKRLTAVTQPENTGKVSDSDWSSSVDISKYYTFGKLSPATSNTGLNIFYTDDATGIGKTLKGQGITAEGDMDGTGTLTAAFTQADTADALGAGNKTVAVGTTSLASDPYSTTGAYYVDIPVWFRTMETGEVSLAVKATFTEGTNSGDLVHAARVSILSGNNDTTATNTSVQGVIRDTNSGYYRTASGAKLEGNATPYTISAYASNTATWTAVTSITQYTDVGENGFATGTNLSSVVTVPASTTSGEFGASAAYTIRVWLEGEDVNCYNANAGQDFKIDLSFAKINTTT